MTISPPLRTVLLYVLVSALWIGFSDYLLTLLVHDPARLALLRNLKRWLFVLATATLLYWLTRRDLQRLKGINRRLRDGNEQSLGVLVSAMDIRHKETGDHSDRVMRMAVRLGRLAGMQGEAIDHLRFGALLHDIGKLAIPDQILTKCGKLDEHETALMREHTRIGHELLQRVDFLRPAAEIPYCHHERWDGAGYPQGLRGTAIPLAARVFSVVDVWDALLSPRVYKPAWAEAEVKAYLREVAGSQLDPQLVALFLDHLDEIRQPVPGSAVPQVTLGVSCGPSGQAVARAA